MPEIETNLAALRRKRGLSAIRLASAAGVSRQTIYAMEAGTFVPNTAVALRMARALEASVEELFALADGTPPPSLRAERAMLLPGSAAQEGQAVQLCRLGKRLMASAPSPVPWYFPAADAVIAGKPGPHGKSGVRVLRSEDDFTNRILVAGCDPGISVLARHVQSAGIELVLAHRNSSDALALLREGYAHVAGTHLRDEASGESNLPAVGRLFAKNSVAVIGFALWEQGILTAKGNPKCIRAVEDLARKDVRIVNREKGSGSRALLDAQLQRARIDSRKFAVTANWPRATWRRHGRCAPELPTAAWPRGPWRACSASASCPWSGSVTIS